MKRRLVWMAVVSLFTFCSMLLPALAAEKLTKSDKSFVKKAASGGMMEVELGQLAKERAKSQEVRAFAQRMVTDHGKASDELKTAVGSKYRLPAKMDPKHKATIEKLRNASDDQFDRKYAEEMVKDHKKDVEKFRKASGKVKDPEIKAWIDRTLPTLEEHLQHAKEMARKVGAGQK